MCLPRSAALLTWGWLLMVPRSHDVVLLGFPVERWTQVEAFDTADACEQVRRAPAGRALGNPATEARCVPADHVYAPRARSSRPLQRDPARHPTTR